MQLTTISANAPSSCDAALHVSVVESRLVATTLLATAKREAAQIVAEAENKAAAVTAEAYRLGFEQGMQQARSSVTAAIEQRKETILQSSKPLLELALHIARDVIGQELRISKDSLVRRIERGLIYLSEQVPVTISINSEDHAQLADELSKFPGRVIPDSRIASGNAKIQGVATLVELDFRDHFERYRSQLLG